MAWIKMVEEDEATGAVKEAYEWGLSQNQPGEVGVSEVIKVFSLRPDILQQRDIFSNAITFGGSGLGRYREELIAVSISSIVHCKYWGIGHAEYLRDDGGADLETTVAVSTDWRQARLQPAEHAMLEFGEKLTLLPGDVLDEDVANLRRQGFTDWEILSITLASAYRNYIAQIADALGLELARGHKYAPEILQAFNVGEMEARTTIYGDRLIAPRDHWRRSRPQITLTRPATPAGGVCWIETSVPDTNVFAKLYKEVEQLTGPHPPRNLVLAFGLRPDALRATLDSGRLVGMGGSGLGRRLETIVGLVVASALWVPYMGVHHAQALLDSGGAPAEVRALVDGSPEEVLSGRECEIARFCEKLTCLPSMLAPSDLDALRQHGLDDREILTIVVCASFENFLSRVAAGLGVSLEDEDFAPAAFEAFDVAALRWCRL